MTYLYLIIQVVLIQMMIKSIIDQPVHGHPLLLVAEPALQAGDLSDKIEQATKQPVALVGHYSETFISDFKGRQDLVFSVKLQVKLHLCARQFRKPQVQKLCFIPPKIIFIKVHFGS